MRSQNVRSLKNERVTPILQKQIIRFLEQCQDRKFSQGKAAKKLRKFSPQPKSSWNFKVMARKARKSNWYRSGRYFLLYNRTKSKADARLVNLADHLKLSQTPIMTENFSEKFLENFSGFFYGNTTLNFTVIEYHTKIFLNSSSGDSKTILLWLTA